MHASEVLAGAEDDGADEGGVTRGHVHDSPPGEVEDAGLHEEAVRVPGHVGQGAVDEDGEEDDEDQVGGEADTLGNGTGNQRRGDDGELELEGEDISGFCGRTTSGEVLHTVHTHICPNGRASHTKLDGCHCCRD